MPACSLEDSDGDGNNSQDLSAFTGDGSRARSHHSSSKSKVVTGGEKPSGTLKRKAASQEY